MNRARYEGLPADLRAVIDANSGLAAAEMAGKVWDEAAGPARELAVKRGNQLYTLPDDEAARWRDATLPVVDAWLAAAEGRRSTGRRCSRPPGPCWRSTSRRPEATATADTAEARRVNDDASSPRQRHAGAVEECWVGRVSVWVALAGGCLVLAIAVLVTASVVRRWLTSDGIGGDFELVQTGLALGVFAFLPLCQLRDANIVVDTFTARLPARARGGLDALWAATYALAAGILAWRLGGGRRRHRGERHHDHGARAAGRAGRSPPRRCSPAGCASRRSPPPPGCSGRAGSAGERAGARGVGLPRHAWRSSRCACRWAWRCWCAGPWVTRRSPAGRRSSRT
jgi:hypothetical protein